MARRAMINTSDVAEPFNLNVDLHSDLSQEDIHETIAVVTNESMQSANVAKYARDLAFMEEKVVFTVHPGPKEEPPVITLGVNGDNVVVTRGVPIKCARKFLNTLFTMTHEMATEQYTDTATGLTQTRVLRRQQPAYSVSVLEDTPEGRNWFATQQRYFYA